MEGRVGSSPAYCFGLRPGERSIVALQAKQDIAELQKEAQQRADDDAAKKRWDLEIGTVVQILLKKQDPDGTKVR